MRYGLGELKGGEKSVLRDRVSQRMARMEVTITDVHRDTGISPTTLRSLGSPGKADSDQVLETLSDYLSIALEELKRARAADIAARDNPEGWPADVWRLAVSAARLGAADQRRLLRIADVIADEGEAS